MSEVFLKILNMSFVASWLILAVILLRLALKQAPKWITCALWALVAIRLVCPFSPKSPLSVIRNQELIKQAVVETIVPEVSFETLGDQEQNDWEETTKTPEAVHVLNEAGVAAGIWALGVVLLLSGAGVSYGRLHRRVRPSLHLRDNIWLCDEIATPFLLGVLRSKIYIPSGVEEQHLPHIIAHENAHMKRRDHWWKPLGFLVLAIHWFNPLVWVAYTLLGRDIELACDEKVVRNLDKRESVAYSEALLSCSIGRRTMLVCPLAFGEVGVKERVRRVMNYKEPTLRILIVSAAACVILAACFLTNPMESNGAGAIKNREVGEAAELWEEVFESGNFLFEGDSVFYGEEKTSICHVVEQHNGEDYRIKRQNKTYIKEGNQYYMDEGKGQGVIAVPASEELAQIEEMFNRHSEISNYKFSDLCLDLQYSTEVPGLEGDLMKCQCLEYRVKRDLEESLPPLKIYFFGEKLYAIQSRGDERFLFYVESWNIPTSTSN